MLSKVECIPSLNIFLQHPRGVVAPLRELFPNWMKLSLKPVFHSFISLPPAQNYDSKIIFLCPFAAKEISSGPPIVENVLLLLHLLFMELQNN